MLQWQLLLNVLIVDSVARYLNGRLGKQNRRLTPMSSTTEITLITALDCVMKAAIVQTCSTDLTNSSPIRPQGHHSRRENTSSSDPGHVVK
jgi:hypothetical protein